VTGSPVRNVVLVAVCAVFPAIWLLDATIGQALGDRPYNWFYAVDFQPVWHAGHLFLEGRQPYPRPGLLLETAHARTHYFVYTMPVAALFSPLGALPYGVAAAFLTLANIAAILGSLWLLGVRDWRCYGIAFATPAVTTAVSYGTLTPLLVLAVAIAWRYRDSKWAAGVALGLAVVAKLFLWPLVLWLLVTRRFRAAGIAVATALGLLVVSWARIGFHDAHAFPALMRNLAQIQAPRGDGLSALVGTGPALWGLSVALLALGIWVGKRSTDERVLFTILTVLSVWLSPIVWTHYYALLIPLLALWAPRLGPAWFVMFAYWLTLGQSPDAHWRAPVALLAAAAVVLLAVRPVSAGRERVARLEQRTVRA
jgi:hypothetical protein